MDINKIHNIAEEKSLKQWFKEKWVDISRPKKGGGFEPCGRDDTAKGKYPKCVPASKASKMSSEEIRSAISRKRRAESTQTRVDKKPIYVSTEKDGTKSFEVEGKAAIPTNPELYARVKAEAKAKFDVYPSAYANAWLVREYKKRGGGYRSEKSDDGDYEESLKDLTEMQLSDFYDWVDERSELSQKIKGTELKIIGTPIGNPFGDKIPTDGDGDGMFSVNNEDNVPLPAAAKLIRNITKRRPPKYIKADPKRREAMLGLLRKGGEGGFTVDRAAADDIKTGISVGRNRHGIRLNKSDVFDENGQPKESAIKTLMAWVEFHGTDVFLNPKETAREVGIGGWLDGEDFYVDVVDIYENTPENLARAPSLGKAENQISVANLNQIQIALETGDWSGTTIDSGGDGAETMDISMLDDIVMVYSSTGERKSVQPTRQKALLLEMLISLQSFDIIIEKKEGT